jgi:hypothetical protein
MYIMETKTRTPGDLVMRHVCRLSLSSGKPIMLDYWTKSLEKEVVIGERPNKERLLVKNEDEYTSPIAKLYKVENEYIIETENSLYIVDSSIPAKRIKI